MEEETSLLQVDQGDESEEDIDQEIEPDQHVSALGFHGNTHNPELEGVWCRKALH